MDDITDVNVIFISTDAYGIVNLINEMIQLYTTDDYKI